MPGPRSLLHSALIQHNLPSHMLFSLEPGSSGKGTMHSHEKLLTGDLFYPVVGGLKQ